MLTISPFVYDADTVSFKNCFIYHRVSYVVCARVFLLAALLGVVNDDDDDITLAFGDLRAKNRNVELKIHRETYMYLCLACLVQLL